ncbi:MAG: Nif3-like dinuclear metal center hexameric protein [Bryobacteraceae bacterium]
MNIRIVLVLLALGAALFGQQSGALTARQVIERIQAHVGVPWRSETVDTFKAGDPETRVTGIATTMMATYDVLVRAAAAGKNLIITHEPTFYSHLDRTEGFEKEHDAVWAEKERFIKEHNLVVWRFHDHWHMMKPDGIMFGVVRALGWQKFQSASEPSLFVVPEMTVAQLAEQMKARLGIHVLRYVANPEMKVARVGLAPGASGPERHLKLLRRDDVEVLAIGEVPEWETIEYVTDAVSEGKKKALILLGHIPSEQPGMEYCAEWLKTFVSEVPVEFIATKEPFLLAK